MKTTQKDWHATLINHTTFVLREISSRHPFAKNQIKYPILFQLDWSTELIVILFSLCLSLLLNDREENTRRKKKRERERENVFYF